MTVLILHDFRDYSRGIQVLIQYDGSDPQTARVVTAEYPGSKGSGPSRWEMARVQAIVEANPTVVAALGTPVAILDLSWTRCPVGPRTCWTAQLGGRRPSGSPVASSIAPEAIVDFEDGRLIEFVAAPLPSG